MLTSYFSFLSFDPYIIMLYIDIFNVTIYMYVPFKSYGGPSAANEESQSLSLSLSLYIHIDMLCIGS